VRHLRALVALVDRGSMTAAARELGVAQSTVSEAVASLDRVLGVPAVARRRGGHGVALTSAGRALLPHARAVLAALEQAELAVATATREVRARVEVIANESVSTYLLPLALPALRERWPNTRFTVTVGTCDEVRAGIAGGDADVGVLLESAKRGSRARDDGAVALAALPLVLFCGPSHPWAKRRQPASTRELISRFPVFACDASGEFHALLQRHFRPDRAPSARLEPAGTVEAVKRTVLGSAEALGVLPSYAIVEELRSGRAHVVAVEPALPRVTLEVLVAPARGPRPIVDELIAALRDAVGDASRPPAPPSSRGPRA
jgi:molybdate transport repressor ModE-like protein